MHSSARLLAAAALAVACTFPAAAFAQAAPLASPAPGMHRHHGHGGGYMRALRTLGLSDAQKQQIQTAMQQSRQSGQNADPAARKANREKLRAQIDGILTADQRTRLRTALAQQRQQRRTMGAPGSAPQH